MIAKWEVKDFFDQSNIWVVVVEPDGEQPPTTWYNFLSEVMNIKTRRLSIPDKDEVVEPLVRRGGEEHPAVTAQECVYFFSSEAAAKTVANEAEYYQKQGVFKNIFMGQFRPTELVMSEAEKEAILNMRRKRTQRGRPSKEQSEVKEFTVTCKSCANSFKTETSEKKLTRCPNCYGTLIEYYSGEDIELRENPDLTNVQNWFSHRFIRGRYHITELSQDTGKNMVVHPDHINTVRREPKETYGKMLKSPAIDFINKMDIDEAFYVLDAIYCSVSTKTTEQRTIDRQACVAKYFEQGGQPDTRLKFKVSDEVFDLIDASSIIGSDKATRLTLEWIDN